MKVDRRFAFCLMSTRKYAKEGGVYALNVLFDESRLANKPYVCANVVYATELPR